MARIYQTSSFGEAHIRVALVRTPGAADLLVARVASWGAARGDTHWFITDNKQDANVYICFTSAGMAQVKVCFVDAAGIPGWQDRGQAALRFKGRFG